MTALCKSAGVLQPAETLSAIVLCFGSLEKGCATLTACTELDTRPEATRSAEPDSDWVQPVFAGMND